MIIDVQNDFMQDGSLEVPDANAILPAINRLQASFDLIIATQDWHPPDHKSFASNHPNHDVSDVITLHGLEQKLWPDHCVQGSNGAAFHEALETRPIEAIFRKGMNPEIDSYSGFYDNGHKKSTGLTGFLHEKDVDEIYFCGLAADVCVYYSIQDALEEGFCCWLIEDATKPINQNQFNTMKEKLIKQNVKITTSERLLE